MLTEDRGGARRLAPLLAVALGRHGAPADPRAATTLRTARFREELRTRAFRDVLASALSLLHAGGLHPLVVRGAAAADTVYPDPALRHTHRIDLLLDGPDLGRAVNRLCAAGWTRTEDPRAGDLYAETLVHGSGVPLRLSARLLDPPYDDPPADELRSRSRIHAVAGVPARVTSPSDALVETCAQASARGPDGLLWACDAWFLLELTPRLDWPAFLASALGARAAVPIAATLEYVARDLGARVPDAVLLDLRRAAAGAERSGRDGGILAAGRIGVS